MIGWGLGLWQPAGRGNGAGCGGQFISGFRSRLWAESESPTALLIGDSLIDTQAFVTNKASIWAERVPRLLRLATGRPELVKPFEMARTGYGPASGINNIHWSFSGGSYTAAPERGLGSVTRTMASGASSALTWTLPAGVSAIDVYYTGKAASGLMRLRIDGTPIDTWTTATGSGDLSGLRRRVNITPPTNPFHLDIVHVSGNGVHLDGIYYFAGNESDDTIFLHSGFGGRYAAQWVTFDSGELLGELVAHTEPDLVVLSAGTADWINGGSSGDVSDAVEACIQQLRAADAALEIVLLLVNPVSFGAPVITHTAFIDILKGLAQTYECATFDLGTVLGSFAVAGNPYDSGDQLHSNEAGQIAIADAMSAFLAVPV